MEDNFKFLILGKKGCYIEVFPDFELMKLVETKQVVEANTLTPFGFVFTHQHFERVDELSNIELEYSDLKKKTFRICYDKLYEKCNDYGARHVLVSGLECSDGALNYRVTIEHCQFFV